MYEFNRKVKETIYLLNKFLNEIPVLVGNFGIYRYFENFLHMYAIYKEKDFFNDIELLVSKNSFSSLKKTLLLNGFQSIDNSTFQKEDIVYHFDRKEKYNIDLKNAYIDKNFPSFTLENEKIIWKQNDIEWKYYILNYENLEKYYERKKDKRTLAKINALWKESLKQKEKESLTFLNYKKEDTKEDKNDVEYLEIVSDFASLGVIKKVFPDHVKQMMSLALHIGDIKDIYKGTRSWLLENNEDYQIEKSFQKLHDLLPKVKKVRIWSSRICADEFLMFCFLCDYIKEKDISVIFADEFLEETWSIGCMTKEEVKALSLKEHFLTTEEVEYYKKIWKKAIEANSEIRYMKNKKVMSVSFDYFTDIILQIIEKNQEISISKLTALLMGERVIENFGSFEYYYLIKRLIELGKLEVVKNGTCFDNVKYFGEDNFPNSIIKVKST